jgi:hypothetical protein
MTDAALGSSGSRPADAEQTQAAGPHTARQGGSTCVVALTQLNGPVDSDTL